jgi:adenosylmethionine-8-amino-7-oxononanoate aminotransferase
LASLELFALDPQLQRQQQINAVLTKHLQPFTWQHSHIANIRQTGTIAAFDLVQDKASKTPFDWRERRGLQVFQSALAKGVLLRPIGNTVYFMPPYVISDEELRWVVKVAGEAVDEATYAPAKGSDVGVSLPCRLEIHVIRVYTEVVQPIELKNPLLLNTPCSLLRKHSRIFIFIFNQRLEQIANSF